MQVRFIALLGIDRILRITQLGNLLLHGRIRFAPHDSTEVSGLANHLLSEIKVDYHLIV